MTTPDAPWRLIVPGTFPGKTPGDVLEGRIPDDKLKDRWEQAEKIAEVVRARKPRPPRSLLGIGCGYAYEEIYLAKHFAMEEVHLLDGVGEGVKQRFGSVVAPWGFVSRGMALAAPNLPDVRIVPHLVPTLEDVWRADAKLDVRVDLIISLKSWGHHYPVDTYLELTKRCLVNGGLLVLDIRGDVSYEDLLRDLSERGRKKVVEWVRRKNKKLDQVMMLEYEGFRQECFIPNVSSKGKRMVFKRIEK